MERIRENFAVEIDSSTDDQICGTCWAWPAAPEPNLLFNLLTIAANAITSVRSSWPFELRSIALNSALEMSILQEKKRNALRERKWTNVVRRIPILILVESVEYRRSLFFRRHFCPISSINLAFVEHFPSLILRQRMDVSFASIRTIEKRTDVIE